MNVLGIEEKRILIFFVILIGGFNNREGNFLVLASKHV